MFRPLSLSLILLLLLWEPMASYAGLNSDLADPTKYPYVFETLFSWNKKEKKLCDEPGPDCELALNGTGAFVSSTTFVMASHSFNKPENFKNYQPFAGQKPVSGFRFDGHIPFWPKEESEETQDEQSWVYWLSFDIGFLNFTGVDLPKYLEISDRPFKHTGRDHPVRYLGFGSYDHEMGDQMRWPLQTGLNFVTRIFDGSFKVWGPRVAWKDRKSSQLPSRIKDLPLPWYGDSGGPILDESTGKLIGTFSWITSAEVVDGVKGHSVWNPSIHHPSVYFLVYHAVHCQAWVPDAANNPELCLKAKGLEMLLQTEAPNLNYGFQTIDKKTLVKTSYPRSCAANFLESIGQNAVHIVEVNQTKVNTFKNLLHQINKGAPNDRSALTIKWRSTDGNTEGTTEFLRETCMPKVQVKLQDR